MTAQVHNFKLSNDILVARGEAGPASDQERAVRYLSLRPTSTLLTVLPLQDLIKSAQSVKAYFAINRAVAAMYNQIHVSYLDQGLDLLHDLSRASTNAMRAKRQRALDIYCQRVATELETYVERVEYSGLLVWSSVHVLTRDRKKHVSSRILGVSLRRWPRLREGRDDT